MTNEPQGGPLDAIEPRLEEIERRLDAIVAEIDEQDRRMIVIIDRLRIVERIARDGGVRCGGRP